MKTIEELQAEMKALMELEIVRMRLRHMQLMKPLWWQLPLLVVLLLVTFYLGTKQ